MEESCNGCIGCIYHFRISDNCNTFQSNYCSKRGRIVGESRCSDYSDQPRKPKPAVKKSVMQEMGYVTTRELVMFRKMLQQELSERQPVFVADFPSIKECNTALGKIQSVLSADGYPFAVRCMDTGEIHQAPKNIRISPDTTKEEIPGCISVAISV